MVGQGTVLKLGSDHKICCLPKAHLKVFITVYIYCKHMFLVCGPCDLVWTPFDSSHLLNIAHCAFTTPPLTCPKLALLLLVNHLCDAQTLADCLCVSFTLSNILLAHFSICSVEYNTKGTQGPHTGKICLQYIYTVMNTFK